MREALAIFKRNDKNTAPGNEHIALKHGDLVDVYDNQDLGFDGKSFEDIYPDRMREAFGAIKIDPKKLSLFRGYLKPHNGERPIAEYRPRIKRLNMGKLATLTGVVDIDNKLHSGDKLPFLDGTNLKETDFDDATLLNNDVQFVDVRAIGAGLASIGAGGAAPNYLTWGAGFADLINLTAGLEFRQANNTTEAGAVQITENLAGNALSLTTDTPHLGNINTGWLTIVNHNLQAIDMKQQGAGITNISGLHIRRDVAGGNATTPLIRLVSGIATAFTSNIYNNIIDGNSLVGAGIRTSDATPILIVYANILCDLSNGIILDAADGNVNSKYENNSICGCTAAGVQVNNNNASFTNNAVMGNGTDWANLGAALCVGRNNADSDGTAANGNWGSGAENRPNLATAAQWQSLTAADGDTFLLPVDGSTIDNDGLTPVYATTLINGTPWVSEIGAKGIIPPTPSGVTPQPHTSTNLGLGIF